MRLLPRFDDAQVQDAIQRLQEDERRKLFGTRPKAALDQSIAEDPGYTQGPKFEPVEKSPDMTRYNEENPPPPAPVFNPVAAAAEANVPQVRQPLPTFHVPPEPLPAAVMPRLSPVFDAHGAPTGEVHGEGSELEKRRAAVEAEEGYKPENHNSRIASAGLGAARGFQRGGVLGALFGAIDGAVSPSRDEEYAHNRRLGIAEGGYKRAAGREDDTQKVLNDETERAAKAAKAHLEVQKEQNDVSAKERADALKNLEKYENLDVTNPTHAAAILRARKALWDIDPVTWNAGNVQTVFDEQAGVLMQRRRGSDKWEQSRNDKGEPITTKTQRQEKLPDSFYQLDGQDEKTIHADAVAKAGARDFSAKAEIDPAKKQLMMDQLGLSEQDITDGIQLGTIKLAELVKDSQKDEARRYDAAVAAQESGALKRHNLYRQAVDQTQTATASAPVVSIATFQQKYKEFYDAYNKLYKKDPAAAEQKRADFFATLRNFRLR